MYKFIKSATDASNMLNDHQKEVAFIGRSNVGKSSLINSIANQKKLARTSNTPGRTQLINFFQDNKKTLVDLPGYGFARISKQQQEKMFQMIEDYFKEREQLVHTFLLVDSRIGPTNDDIIMMNFLSEINRDFTIILTKVDKVNQSVKHKTTNKIKSITDNYLFVSSIKKTNIKILNEKINKFFI